MRFNQQTPILFISSYPPRKCGIASFTEDLVNAINTEIKNGAAISICALDKKNTARLYEHPVTMLMDSFDIDSCIEAAMRINRDDSIKLICIEHEFGLFGGELGEYLLGFLSILEKPFIVRFHTVLPAPSPKRLKIIQTISLLADKVIVMTNHSASLLETDYSIPGEKILRIPHGTHNHSTTDPLLLKHRYNLDNRLVLTNFGLLSPNKGIEKGIMAMKEISKKFPEAIYLVLGQTHPSLIAQEGEKYRDYLLQLITDNNLQKNVRLINEYIPTERLMEYLTLTDIYLFTSKDPNQAMSGTFLYAMSAGCPIISNSFVLAKEMLDGKTGIILETNDEKELAAHAVSLLQNKVLRKQMGYNAFVRTRNTAWKKVAAKHIQLFAEIAGSPVSIPGLSNQFVS
jgi:glycosyltransferase involved in cell wall biosynthesis